MTYKIANETFDKFRTTKFLKFAKVIAWIYRKQGYKTTIEHTFVTRSILEKPFADYRTVFAKRRYTKQRTTPRLERFTKTIVKLTKWRLHNISVDIIWG